MIIDDIKVNKKFKKRKMREKILVSCKRKSSTGKQMCWSKGFRADDTDIQYKICSWYLNITVSMFHIEEKCLVLV